MTAIAHGNGTFYGWRVVGAAFVLGRLRLGHGLLRPARLPERRARGAGLAAALVSTAVSLHFLVGAVVGAKLPALHRRFGAAGSHEGRCADPRLPASSAGPP